MYTCCVLRIVRDKVLCHIPVIVLLSTYLVSCSPQVRLPSAEQLAEFENAGPILPSVDVDHLMRAKMVVGPYRVVPGDVLELTMPVTLQVVTAEQTDFPDRLTVYLCRVSENGTITLPVVGDIKVAGKSLAEIESAVIQSYYPKYTATPPPAVVRVTEYNTARASITGAVQNPGVYELRSDQMSLVALLMEAGGIVDEGAAVIRITHSDEAIAATDKATAEKMPEQVFKERLERLPEPTDIKAPVYPASYVVPDEIEVQLAFQQMDPPSTLGRLIIRNEEAIVLNDRLDITSEVQRHAVLEKLAQREPRVSTAKVGQRLYALADILKPDPNMRGSENRIAGKSIGSNMSLSVSNLKHDLASGHTPYKQLAHTYGQRIETLDVESPPGITNEAEWDNLQKREPVVLPVKGLNIPSADVALQDGDAVVVERLEQRFFTVMGLVNQPGNFPYPVDANYNLMQALAFAGGLDKTADPRYASIYRLKADGAVADTTLKIVEGSKLTDALSVKIKPGDIVDVAHTARTRRNLFLERIFNVNFGAYVPVFR